jgi:short-subunit dehydrogenase
MKHALITGASSGIGAALAKELGRRGYAVGLVARRVERLEELASELRASGVTCAWAAADVTDREATQGAFARLEDELGPLDVMVANAGIGGQLDPTQWKHEPIRAVMEVNFFGAVHAAEAAVPGMLERGRGTLVVISSVAASRGLPGAGPYSASKAAISSLWESLRVSLRPRGIRCVTINPGFIESELTARNDFDMPFIIPAEPAARSMVDSIERQDRESSVPWVWGPIRWLMVRVPNWLYDWAVGPKK